VTQRIVTDSHRLELEGHPKWSQKGFRVNHRISPENIRHAMHVIDPVFLDSPQFINEPLSDALGCRLITKLETLNPIRSFKGRGTWYFVAGLESGARIVCASAGNFGQGLAFAVRARNTVKQDDVALTVYASVNANPLKLERMRSLGANVVLEGEDFDAAKLAAKRFARESGATMVEDGLIPSISEGAGTIGIELAQWPEQIEAVLVPLGNGALLNGVARWFRHASPQTQVIAVQASGAPAMIESWREGRVIQHERISTMADGIGVRVPIPEAVSDMHGLVDDGLLVEENAILEAMRLLHQHLGLVVEPSGAAGVAAILENRARFAGRLVATVICGGNLTPQQVRDWLIA
jgi:threonine dehydratase